MSLPNEEDIVKKDAEQKVEVVDELKVEVVDDTPDPDKGKEPLPKEVVQELEEDDLSEYSDRVKKRLSQMKKVWHDERREKERALREREEAIRYAQSAAQQAQQYRDRLGKGEKVSVTEMTKAAEAQVSAARSELKKAFKSGDAELITSAQEMLTDAKIKLKEAQMLRPSLPEQEQQVERQPEQTQTLARPAVDPKAEAWRSRNTWFGADEEMTSLALGLHEKLVRSGVDPRTEDYYRQIDETMKKRFPEYFEGERTTSEPEKTVRAKPATVVAPVTRSTAPRKVQLSASQVAVAKKLGLTPEAYARELIKLENQNGR